jgi:cytochrome b
MKQMTTRSVAVWDLPTRLFHWGLAASFAVAWLTAEGDRWLTVHVFAGYLMLGLLAFRLVWGLVGGRYARFRDFTYGWREARDYVIDLLRGRARRYLGHNPAGAWAVFALIALGFAVSLTGLMLLGAQEGQGPLAGWLGFPLGNGFEELHEAVASAMLALVLVHIAGVLVESLVHRENLVHAMFTGYKRQEGTAPGSAMHRAVAVALIATAAAAATLYFSDSPEAMAGNPDSRFSVALPERAEAGSFNEHDINIPGYGRWED